MLSRGPDSPHDACDDSCHTETEEDGTDEELVAPLAVLLEDIHVGSGGA